MFINEISKVLPFIFPKLIWKINELEIEKTIYLTFDDGPTPEITNYVLDLLTKYKAKATFFCIGKNIISNQELAKRILIDGTLKSVFWFFFSEISQKFAKTGL